MKKIDFRKGSGSAVLGMVLLTVCFAVALIVMEQGKLFYRASKTQMVSDVIADGATVYAQTPMGVDELKLNQIANELASRNQSNNVNYTLHQPIVTDVLVRTDYIDKQVNQLFPKKRNILFPTLTLMVTVTINKAKDTASRIYPAPKAHTL